MKDRDIVFMYFSSFHIFLFICAYSRAINFIVSVCFDILLARFSLGESWLLDWGCRQSGGQPSNITVDCLMFTSI